MTNVQARALRTASDLLGRELNLVDVFTGGQHATTLMATDGDSEFVVRAFPAHHDAAVREAEVLGRLSTLGAGAPRLIAVSNELVDPVIVTSRVFGSAPAADLSPLVIAAEMAAALMRIHELDGDGLRPTPGGPPRAESALATRARREWASLDMRDPVLIHSDFWCGNALWEADRLTGVVDWSGARSGPRGVDLAWCRQDLVLLGSPSAAGLFLEEYERLLGITVDDIDAWDVQAAASATSSSRPPMTVSPPPPRLPSGDRTASPSPPHHVNPRGERSMDTSELDDVLSIVREFVREKVVPIELDIEANDAIPESIIRESAEMGLFGWALPEEYGGLGMNAEQDAQLAMELGYTTPAFRSVFGTNNGIAGQVLVNYGTAEQKSEWLPKLTSGDVVASFALTESEAGSDPSGMRTRAVREGDDYIISGSKRFITNAEASDVLMVFARTDPNAQGSKGISVFLVPTATEGVTVGSHDAKMGQAGAWTSEIFFDDVRVPAANLVGGEEEKGFYAAMASLNKGRLHIAAICVGQATRILDESVNYAAEAKQGGEPIARFQLVQAMLADIYTEVAAAKALVLAAAKRWDADEDRKLGPSSAKLFASEALGRIADKGVQIQGGTGYMRESAVERFYRHARLFRIYEGTSEVQRVVVARQLLKGAHKPQFNL